ncbi:MAG: response regulator [Bdellovibrionales bacterium]|nr:response regulator [Bdellovibrionales bacterium]
MSSAKKIPLNSAQNLQHWKADKNEGLNEKELRAHYERALEGACLGMWDWNPVDNSVRFDRRWCEMIGLDFESTPMELKTWEDRVHPEDLKKCYDDIKAYLNGLTPFYENIHRMKHANGHWVYILDRGKIAERAEDGSPVRFTGTHFDISIFEKNRKMLSVLFDNSPMGFLFCDKNGLIRQTNKAFLSFFENNALPTNTCLVEDIVFNWDRSPLKLNNSSLKNSDCTHFEGFIKDNQGVEISVNVTLFGVDEFLEDGGYWLIVEDQTESLRIASALKKQQEIALHSARLASIGELAAGVGHEINNPLMIIFNAIESVNPSVREDPSMSLLCEKVEAASVRIKNIVEGLRSFGRLNDSNNECIDLYGLIRKTISMLREIFEKEGVSISADLVADMYIEGSAQQIQQVLINLLTNARDACREVAEPNIHITLKRRNNCAWLKISDNGKGIPQEIQNRVFDAFFTTKDVNEGTGIGLSIVHSIVESHGGKISFRSRPGKKTTFQLLFPLTEMACSVAEKVACKKNVHCRPLQILLVDDEPDIGELLANLIESLGHTVTTATNAKMALSILKEIEVDVVLSDLKMPHMNGNEFFQEIRKRFPQNKAKLFLMTGGISIEPEFKREGSAASTCDDYLFKPFKKAQLQELLCRYFS